MAYLVYIIVSILLGASSYIIAQNIVISVSVLFCFLLYFVFIFDPYFKRNNFISLRYSECYNFINTFIIALSIKGTLMGSLEACELNFTNTLKEANKRIEHMNIEERLTYLSKYFPFYIYDLFLNIVTLHVDQGGDILSSSKHLLKETRQIEEQKDQIRKASIRKLGEIIVLWLITIVILIVIRFALTQFYDIIVSNLYFSIGIALFYAFMLISLYFSLKQIFANTIKGVKEIEKVKKSKFRTHSK